MGRYIQTSGRFDKANEICSQYGAVKVSQQEAEKSVTTHGVIVVVDNGMFEAAGYADTPQEFQAFTRPEDTRYKEFLLLPRERAEELAK